MAAFSFDMSNPLPSGFTIDRGGPGLGGHNDGEWFIKFGMDLGAAKGTDVFAAFEGKVSVFHKHEPSKDTAKEFGAQIFARSLNGMMGGFYTHITDVPATASDGSAFGLGSTINPGDFLGKVHHGHGAPHLHLALVEIIGGWPKGRYMGISSLHKHFVTAGTTSSATVGRVTFNQDGTQPTII